MLYFGRVTRTDDNMVYCTIPDLAGPDQEFGPLPIIEWTLPLNYHTAVDAVSAHIYHTHVATLTRSKMLMVNPWHGEKTIVVVAQIGLVKEDMVVLGSLPWGMEHD